MDLFCSVQMLLKHVWIQRTLLHCRAIPISPILVKVIPISIEIFPTFNYFLGRRVTILTTSKSLQRPYNLNVVCRLRCRCIIFSHSSVFPQKYVFLLLRSTSLGVAEHFCCGHLIFIRGYSLIPASDFRGLAREYLRCKILPSTRFV